MCWIPLRASATFAAVLPSLIKHSGVTPVRMHSLSESLINEDCTFEALGCGHPMSILPSHTVKWAGGGGGRGAQG